MAGDFDRFSHIVAMDADNVTAINAKARTDSDRKKVLRMADFLRTHPGRKSIPDPYYGSDRDFELVIELLEDACEGLVNHICKTLKQE